MPRKKRIFRLEKDNCGVGFIADIKGRRTRKVLDLGIESVKNLVHRGAVSADGKTGDGAGILTQIPLKIVRKELEKKGINEKPENIGIGVFFLPTDGEKSQFIMEETEKILKYLGLSPLFWRDVPVDENALGEIARKEKPDIKQIFVSCGDTASQSREKRKEIERKLFIARKYVEKKAEEKRLNLYIPSFSSTKVVYKGLFISTQIDNFYLDLQDPDFETAICLFHQRYSTNTHPHWFIAQPFRYLAHNGEINTLFGNINWQDAREKIIGVKNGSSWSEKSVWSKDEIEIIKPIIWKEGSDSSMLDNVLEFIYLSGRDLPTSMAILIPEPYEVVKDMDENVRAFFEYFDYFTEPWDGPAAVAFTDGIGVGACLDRNGLRPARYLITKDDIVVMGSEVGIVDIPLDQFVEIDRLGPGKMIYIDTEEGKFYHDEEIKKEIAKEKPYRTWVKKSRKLDVEISPDSIDMNLDEDELLKLQKVFGYTEEDIERFFKEMCVKAKEATYAMGDDTPFSFMSSVPRNIFSYFKQRFAQVTNPPIDPYREYIVMSLSTTIGEKGDILEDSEKHAEVVRIPTPVITEKVLEDLKKFFPHRVFSTTFSASDPSSLKKEIERLIQDVCDAVEKDGVKLIILSDRDAGKNWRAPIPSLMAVGAVHNELVRRGLRLKTSIIVDSGEPREEHHFASLLGYGADAICPWLAFKTAYYLKEEHRGKQLEVGDRWKFVENYKTALEKGIKKIMSKMGISVLSSYRGAQIFEVVGLSREVVDLCFEGTPSWFEDDGVDFEGIARDYIEFYRWSEDGNPRLPNLGLFKFIRDKELHDKNPFVFRPLHKFTQTGKKEFYEEFTRQVQSRPPMKIRDLFDIKPLREPIPVEEVEPIENILRRLYISSMSFGALSPETHESLAIAINRVGANMGSGEGGEDPKRFERYENGDWANSTMKQIASGRFGVTAEYAVNCRELEIKIAQGAKPGEGGQLPGIKVNETIAKVRRTVPGITLISPPPHHDIYSIEDLAQLIYDLKKVNTSARVSVKLVAEAGVGIIASGVAKAYADTVQISGHEGGTGASPASSIKNAGNAWELGLLETQAILMWNDLRDKVRIRVDGGLLNGWDVVKAAVLGADEFGFGTPAMIAVGCVMARQCHLNTCPVGIATQREDLRKRFPGSPERMERYFIAIAEEVREILASLGAKSLDEIIGRIDLIKPKEGIKLKKTGREVDISYLKKIFLDIVEGGEEEEFIPEHDGHTEVIRSENEGNKTENGVGSRETSNHLDERIKDIIKKKPTRNIRERNDRPETEEEDINRRILRDAWDKLVRGEDVRLKYKIRNIHRTAGATLAGEIAKKWGDGLCLKPGLPPRKVEIEFEGVAGQSFGAFLVRGMKFVLQGIANDYVGKALSGGEIVIIPPSHNAVAIGNVCLYGGTGGYLFVAGKAGERFAVRNSGVFAVIEGAGDHCMEYMTNGVCVVLGGVGKNLGAGMTGGLGFVLKSPMLEEHINSEFVFLKKIDEEEEFKLLQRMLFIHAKETGSDIPKKILEEGVEEKMLMVVPKEFEKYRLSFLRESIERIERDFEGVLP